MYRFARPIAAATLLLAALLVAGCLNYDERIEVNPDGSGTVRVCLSISEEVIMGMEVDEEGRPLKRKIESEDDLFPRLPDLKTGKLTLNGKEQIVKDFTSGNMKVRSIRAASTGGTRQIYVVADFRDFNKLPDSRVFSDRTCSFRRLRDGTFELRMVVASEAMGKSPLQSNTYQALKARFGEQQARMFLSSYHARFTVEAPGKVVETNGNVWKETKSLWSKTLLEMLGSEKLDLRVRARR